MTVHANYKMHCDGCQDNSSVAWKLRQVLRIVRRLHHTHVRTTELQRIRQRRKAIDTCDYSENGVRPHTRDLTQKLRGRAITPAKRRGRTLSSSARGANQTTDHGPLQRLLDGRSEGCGSLRAFRMVSLDKRTVFDRR